jgi:predicted outer membrane lipoprotein
MKNYLKNLYSRDNVTDGGLRNRAQDTLSKPWYGPLHLFLPVLLLACITIPFAYDNTLTEPDLDRMLAGIIYGNAQGENEAAGKHYGLSFSFGYYKFLYALAPLDWLRNPELLVRLINALGIASGLLCASACAIYLRRVFGRNVAAVTVTLFFLSPMMLPVVLSGHPLIVAATGLFFGGWLLSRSDLEQCQWVFLGYRVGAFVILTLSLTLRAEVVLAFPFLWLASTYKLGGFRVESFWKIYGSKAIVLAGAFVVFLVLQQDYVDSNGSFLTLYSFIQRFFSLSHMPVGLAVLALTVGWVSLIVAFISVIRLRFRSNEFFLVSVLALPALTLGLPNPLPARHFFFAGLACAIVIALWLERWEDRVGRTLAAAVCLVFLNQIAAEVTHAPIVSLQEWRAPLVTDRRSMWALPLGAFPLDQISNQEFAELVSNEAVLMAEHVPDRLVIVTDRAHFMIAHLIAAEPELKWTSSQFDGISVSQLTSPTKEIVIVWKRSKTWPKKHDVLADVLQLKQLRDWPVYVQPFTVSKFDRTRVPATRIFTLPTETTR